MFVLLGHNPLLSWHVLLLSLFPFGRWGLLHIHPRVLETCPVLGFGFGFFWSTFLLPGTTRHSSLILYFPCPTLESAISPRSLASFYWRVVLETEMGSEVSLLLTADWLGNVCVYNNPARMNVRFFLSLSAYIFKNI